MHVSDKHKETFNVFCCDLYTTYQLEVQKKFLLYLGTLLKDERMLFEFFQNILFL